MRLRSILMMLVASLASLNAAVIVTPVVTAEGAEFRYNYTVANNEPLSIILFELTLPGNPSSIASPDGWVSNSFASGSDTIVQWASQDMTNDIPSGGSLSGFVIVAPGVVGQVSFAATDTEFQSITGVTTGPNPVPEPATLAVTGMAAGILLLRRRMLQ